MTAARDEACGVDFLRDLMRPPGRSRAIRLLLGAVVVGVVCWFVGMDAWHAATVGGALVAAGIVWLAAPSHVVPEWTDDPADETGTRPEVIRLAWSLRPRRGLVRRAAVDRVRNIARSRLRSRRLDLDDPQHAEAIAGLIGDHAYRVLRDESAPTVPLRSLVNCVDRVEALDEPVPSELPAASVPMTPRRAAPDALHGRTTRHDR